MVVKNSKAGSLVILKKNSLNGEPLEGVTFKVTTSTGEYVPDENGRISSNGLYYTDKDGKITINGVVGTLVAESRQYFYIGKLEELQRISEKELYPLKEK